MTGLIIILRDQLKKTHCRFRVVPHKLTFTVIGISSLHVLLAHMYRSFIFIFLSLLASTNKNPFERTSNILPKLELSGSVESLFQQIANNNKDGTCSLVTIMKKNHIQFLT